jgi:ADP-ribosyl-[dinitrogen reductase] hydrolase
MIIEGAIGDAYGAGFEFAPREKIVEKNTLTQYEYHPKFPRIYKKYTDDTQMAVAIAELLVGNVEWTEINIANKFVEVFKRDPREGYGSRFYKLLCSIEDGSELLERFQPKSDRNGAAMRAYPIGILPDIAQVLERTKIQAQVTHHTEKAIISAQAVALMNHYFLYNLGQKEDLAGYLSDILHYKWNGKWSGQVEINAIETIEAVLQVLTNGNKLSAMLVSSVDFGGDVDTVASLVMAIGSSGKPYVNDLPSWLYDELENLEFGKNYLIDLDAKLRNTHTTLKK